MRATEPNPELSVVVSVFRNAEHLGELAARVERALARRRYELILVDDASPDDARAEIERLAEGDKRVVGVSLIRNVGQSAAILAGFARARGDAVVVLDGDLQDPPEAIPTLLDRLARDDADVVFAARRGRYEPLARLFSGRLLKRTLWLLTLGKVPPNAGLFFAARRIVVERVLAVAPPDPYVLVLVARAARSVATVPVARDAAPRSSYTARMRWRVARRAVSAAVRR